MNTIDGVPVITYDLEVFPNYFLATFLLGTSVKVYEYHAQALDGLRKLAATFTPSAYLCGYNSFSYDDLILGHVLAHPTVSNKDIYDLSKKIISSRHADESIFKMTYARRPWAGSVDMWQILNRRGSLKEWTCRERALCLVESGHDFDRPLPAADFADIRRYCLNDTRVTAQLLATYWPLVALRTQLDAAYRLGKAVYTLSEPGLAQRTFLTLHRRRAPQSMQRLREAATSHPDNTTLWYPLKSIISPRVRFTAQEGKQFVHALRCTTVQAQDKHGVRWRLPARYDQPITFGKGRYKLGVGGLHSIDGPGRWGEADHVWDVDVTSYYPSLIIEEGYYPAHLGPGFVDDMRAMRDRRVQLKKAGDKAGSDALKIVINSAFGKLNDVWSPLRSIPNALRVTINGQLMLLMLIEMMETAGIVVLSANTDGVTVMCAKQATLEAVMAQWTAATKHTLELTRFLRYCRRDVNAYVALKADGTVKSKGAYEQRPIAPGSRWDGIIIKRAVQDYLLHDKPIRATVTAATVDIRDFLFYSRVKNGGTVSAQGLHDKAKTARWYVARRGHRIERLNPKGTRAVLPNAHKARLAMDIEHCDILGLEFLDYDYYITAAEKLAAATKAKT